MGGYHRPVCVETVVGPLHHFLVEGWGRQQQLRRLVGVEPITIVIKSGMLRWYGHVMRKSDEDWVNKCMEYRVEGRGPVGKPPRTWL